MFKHIRAESARVAAIQECLDNRDCYEGKRHAIETLTNLSIQQYLRFEEETNFSSFYQEFVYFGDCGDTEEVCETSAATGFECAEQCQALDFWWANWNFSGMESCCCEMMDETFDKCSDIVYSSGDEWALYRTRRGIVDEDRSFTFEFVSQGDCKDTEEQCELTTGTEEECG